MNRREGFNPNGPAEHKQNSFSAVMKLINEIMIWLDVILLVLLVKNIFDHQSKQKYKKSQGAIV